MFAKKVISIYEAPAANFNSSAFACGHIIVYISVEFPAVMDCLLAEFHKACIYTVPKHILYKKMAGFALHRKFKSQFTKILWSISQQFIQALKDRGDPTIGSVITRLQDYIESNVFLKELEGWSLKDSDLFPDTDHQQQQQNYYAQDRHYYHQSYQW